MVSERTWLDERSEQAVRHALDRCAPELCGGSITLQPWIETGDPQWSVGTAVVEGGFVAKFAWSEPAATRLWHEALVLRALGAHASHLRVDHRRLRVVVDFESCGAAEAEYDFRYLPAQGDGVRLLLATVAHYRDRTQRPLRIDRVMAWHLRTALGDALWRSEAGVALPDGATPAVWVDELRQRLDALALLPR